MSSTGAAGRAAALPQSMRCKRCKCSPAQQESLLGTELCRAQCCASEHRESAVSSAAASPSLQLCSGLCLPPVGSPLECPSVQHCLTSRQMGSRCFPMAGYSLTGAAINFYTVPRVGLTLCCSVCRLGLLKVLLLCAPAVQGGWEAAPEHHPCLETSHPKTLKFSFPLLRGGVTHFGLPGPPCVP